MKTKVLFAILVTFLMTTGFDCVNDPVLVSVFADPISGKFTVNPGSGSFNVAATVSNIQSLIPADYRNKFKGLRVYDVRVTVGHPHPDGAVSGSVSLQLGSSAPVQLLAFTGIQYEKISEGLSLRDAGVTYNAAALSTLFGGITNVSGLPSTATIRAQGSGPPVTSPLSLQVDVFFQVDSEIE